MNIWPVAIDFVLRMETGGDPDGGYTDDPADPGGRTRWGISQRAHPDIDVRILTREGAQKIYHRDYWIPLLGPELPDAVAVALLDWSVHSGVRSTVVRLQRLLGAEVDGVMGARTLLMVERRDPVELAVELCVARARHQGRLIVADPKLVKFAGGWAARVVELTALVSRLRG